MRYAPLKRRLWREGGLRLAMHGRIADQIADAVVAMWPEDCPSERLEEVMQARAAVYLRERYGNWLAMFLISVVANHVVKIIIEWWLERSSHRVLMEGWRAKAAQDLPPSE
jgi:hypothetical protein